MSEMGKVFDVTSFSRIIQMQCPLFCSKMNQRYEIKRIFQYFICPWRVLNYVIFPHQFCHQCLFQRSFHISEFYIMQNFRDQVLVQAPRPNAGQRRYLTPARKYLPQRNEIQLMKTVDIYKVQYFQLTRKFQPTLVKCNHTCDLL